MNPRKVVFVRLGQWGGLESEDYDSWLKVIIKSLGSERVKDSTGKEFPLAEVEVVSDVAALKDLLAKRGSVDRIFFISRSEIETAKALKLERPDLNIAVLTGAIPNNEVPVLSKGWLDVQTLRGLIMYW